MTRTFVRTPAADGFRMPAEFEPHAGCWLLWPERPDNWREAARPAQQAFAAVAAAIARFEPVSVGVSSAQFTFARALLAPGVRVIEMSHDDSWMRDVGPTFVVNRRGAVRGVDWQFNAWGGLNGGLYFPWDQDELVARKVLEVERCGRYRAPLINEGGAIHVDGQGTALVTEQCLLSPNRNPQLSRSVRQPAARTSGCQLHHLATGVFNDGRRPHRRPGLLRRGPGGMPDLDQGGRVTVRDLARRLGAPAGGATLAAVASGDRLPMRTARALARSGGSPPPRGYQSARAGERRLRLTSTSPTAAS
jgi:agmatine deiminase